MATLSDVQLQIAGIGHVFFADKDTTPMTIDSFVFGDESTYGANWTWLGDSSSENLVEFSVDGGDVTFKRTWDRQNVRATRETESISATINSVNVGTETFEIGFGGSAYDAATKSTKVGANTTSSSKAVMLVMEDGSDIAGLYLPSVDLKGSFPTLSLDDFTEIPLNLSILGSDKNVTPAGPLLWQWFHPRPYTAAGGGE